MSHDEHTGVFGTVKDKIAGAFETVKNTIVPEPPIEQRAAGHIEDFTQNTADNITELRHEGSHKMDEAKHTFRDAKDSAAHRFEDFKEGVGDHLRDLRDEGSHKTDQAKDTLRDMRDSAGEKLHEAGSTAKSYYESAKEKVGDAKDAVEHKACEATHAVFGGPEARQPQAADQVQAIAEEVAAKVQDSYEGVEDFGATHPVKHSADKMFSHLDQTNQILVNDS